jgi:Beta-lactamase enzyme family
MSAVATVWKNDPALDAALAAVAPDLEKWAAVILVEGHGAETKFEHYQYRQSAQAQNFWPASCIKLYVMVAALECLTEHGLELDTTVTFERKIEGQWQLDCARSVREMLSEVCRRSSNEDYTLLLRWLGVEHMNTKFFITAKGFAKSALMRGYAGNGRPYGYVLEQPQRITLREIGGKEVKLEHAWSGRFYSEERGGTIIDAKRGNVTTAAELSECLRRVMFHEVLPEAERYRLTPAQLAFLRAGAGGFYGLKTINPDSGPFAWTKAIETLFPRAKFYHKCGVISNYSLETAYVDDEHDSGKRLLLVPVINAGLVTKPMGGEALVGQMARAIGQWARGR